DPTDREYFESVVKPLLDHPLIEFLGPVDEMNKRELIGNALALIVPIHWPEPFGIVFIEALACGTPVLTCPYGSAPELLEDGVTGYMCQTLDELAESALRVRDDISRAQCRAYAKRRFDAERMGRGYAEVYEKVRLSHDTFALPSDDMMVSTIEKPNTSIAQKRRQPVSVGATVETPAALAVAEKAGLLAALPLDADSDSDESAFVP
ncbi:MAG TPA: glycosyltransferase, partial [Ktedonobacterales bacterium]|nr:glycosyltransferase [Ktedonobacterales bacterium]